MNHFLRPANFTKIYCYNEVLLRQSLCNQKLCRNATKNSLEIEGDPKNFDIYK